MSKKSFIMHVDSMSIFRKLSSEQARDLIFAIENYHTSGALPDDPIIAIAFEPFLNQFTRDEQKYKKTCERNKKNISKRWDSKNTTEYQSIPLDTKNTTGISGNHSLPLDTTQYDSIPLDTKNTDSDSDSKSDIDSDSKLKKENINKNTLTSIFINPKEKDDLEVLQNVFEGEPSSEDQSSSKSLQLDEITEKPVKLPDSPCFDLVATDTPKTKKKASGGRKKGDSSDVSFPDNFALTDEMINYAFEKADFANVDIDKTFVSFEFESFCIYWRTQRPTEKRKLESWDGTWKKWILKQIQDKKERMKRPTYSPRVDLKAQKKLEVMKSFEELDRMREEMEAETGRRLSLFKK
jgi:hypothetical protein